MWENKQRKKMQKNKDKEIERESAEREAIEEKQNMNTKEINK